jgi:antitoxin YefM
MSIFTLSEARSKLFHLVDLTNTTHEPIHITGKRGNAVMISEEDYHAIQETIYLNSVKGLAESIIDASNEPLENCSDKLKW